MPSHSLSLNLSQPLKAGTRHLDDVTRFALPSYRRLSLAMGGDFSAGFSFTADTVILERWFDDVLMAHFVESYAGVDTFVGYIHAMRLAHDGMVISKTMDDVFNKVASYYVTQSGMDPQLTTFSSNTDSQAGFGTKELLLRPRDYMFLSTANQYRTNVLAALAQPRQVTETVSQTAVSRPTLQVDIRGYVHTLDWLHYNATAVTSDDADAEITNALAGADFVTAGTITANTLQVSRESDQRPAWKRIRSIADLGDAGSNRYLAGCYQSRILDYRQADETNILYFMDVQKPPAERIVYNVHGAKVPPAMVQPGGVLWLRDTLAGVPQNTTLLNDPRAIFIESVDFTKNGVVFKAPGRRDQSNAAISLALAQSIAATRGLERLR